MGEGATHPSELFLASYSFVEPILKNLHQFYTRELFTLYISMNLNTKVTHSTLVHTIHKENLT